jgi:hypothetical protein
VQIVHRVIDYRHGERPPLRSEPAAAAADRGATAAVVRR